MNKLRLLHASRMWRRDSSRNICSLDRTPACVAPVCVQSLLTSIADTSSSSSSSDSDGPEAAEGSAAADTSSSSSPGPHWEAGCVVNVNFPSAAVGPLSGLALTHQGTGCVFPCFKEITEPTGPHMPGAFRCGGFVAGAGGQQLA